MLTTRYIFKSNELKDRYSNGSIDHQAYLSSLATIKREVEEEIAVFEKQQLQEANQARAQRQQQADELRLQLEAEKPKQVQTTTIVKAKEKPMQPVQPPSLEEQLSQAREDFYQKEAPTIIDGYKRDAKKHRARHDKMQLAVIAGSALATSTTAATIFTNTTNISLTLKVVAACFSLLVSIASGSMAYFKYKERSNDTQKAADTIEDDRSALKLGIGPYKDTPHKDALITFAGNTHKTIAEHKKKQQLLDQPPEAKSNQGGQ
ncbi:hypothetical protein KDH_80000 [Dictyobacter sp. S3.2.2.5]|uniref:SMODS and SLOG-associating 2TM effector domain-containing protein n=1 Tax=Dictyobacter halimunensis TaxID=3026934 RepID=A0ABQ6G3R6_9CHLR|nr:hypothetical protein KDH_80000 [Dictyobacter sp. S3.2.2.5]